MVRKTVELKNLEPGENYYVQVRAISDSEEYTTSNWSTKLTFTAGQNSAAPNAPSNLNVSVDGTSFVGTWTAPGTSEDGSGINDFKDYQITVVDVVGGGSEIYYTTNERFEFTASMNSAAFGKQPSGITNLPGFLRGEIQFIVKSRDTANNLSTVSTSASATNGPPGAFTLVDDDSDTGQTISVSWDTPSGGDILGYRIRRGTATGVYTEERVLIGEGANRHLDTFLPRGTYYYIVEAYDKFGNMTASNEVEAVSKGFWEVDFSIPDAPTISSATTSFDDPSQTAEIDLSFTGPSTADSGALTYDYHQKYIIRWSTSATGPFEYQVIDEGDNTATYDVTIKELTPATLYYYGVQAVSEYGQQGVWQTGSITTESDTSPPAAPAGLSATGSLKNITVSWDANSEFDMDFYKLYASQTSGFTPGAGNKIYQGNGTGFAHAVGDNATWYYKVTATDLSGNESLPSTEASATSTQAGGAQDGTPPADVTITSVTAATYYHGSSERAYADVVWSGGADETALTGFIISYSVDGQVTWNELTAGPTETQYRIPDLEPGVTIAVRMKSIDAAGNLSTNWSATVTDTPTNTDGAIQQAVSITTGGAIESDNFVAGTSGFRLDEDSLEIYGNGQLENVSIIIGSSGLNINTTTDQMWFGNATETNAGFSVNGSGQARLGDSAGTPIYMNGVSGDMYGGASDFIGTGADWILDGDGSATFDNITITGTSAANNTEIMNISNQFIVKKVAAGALIDMAGTMNITGSLNVNNGAITLNGGDLRVKNGDIESSDTWTYGSGVGFRLIGVDKATNPGVLQAQGAQINSLNVAGTSYFGGSVTVTGSISSQSAGWSIQSTGYASFSNIDINGGTLNIGSNFQVLSNGVLTASGAEITGTIYAIDGYLQDMFINNQLTISGGISSRDVVIGEDVFPSSSNKWNGINHDSGTLYNMWVVQESGADPGATYFYVGDGSNALRYDSRQSNAVRIAGNVELAGNFISSATITGGTFQTNSSSNRVWISEYNNDGVIRFYKSSGGYAHMYYDDSAGNLTINGAASGSGTVYIVGSYTRLASQSSLRLDGTSIAFHDASSGATSFQFSGLSSGSSPILDFNMSSNGYSHIRFYGTSDRITYNDDANLLAIYGDGSANNVRVLAGSFDSSSDIKFKEEIVEREPDYRILNVKSFDYKTKSERKNGHKRTGMIAQQILEEMGDDFRGVNSLQAGEDEEPSLAVDIYAMLSTLIPVVSDMNKRLEELEEKLA